MKWNLNLLLPLNTFLLFWCFTPKATAQVFQEVRIRDIAKMTNNWGNAVADFDQDGDLDVFIVAYTSFRSNDPSTWSRLLRNDGSGRFEDVTTAAGFRQQYSNPSIRDHKIGASWGDYDNDGFPDLLLTHSGAVQLYHNRKNGSFDDVTIQSNIKSCDDCVNASALWWDYDRDGNLDLYISDYQQTNQLYRNQGNGRFIDVTDASGLGDSGSTWCSIPFDANKDGWLDLYVINDYGFSRFYVNQEGQFFHDATIAYGLRNTGNAMGATIGDYNRDGNLDIYITNISEFQVNPLFTGTDYGPFVEMGVEQKVGQGHWAWGTRFFDADHDGDEDLYLVNGFNDFVYPNKFFKNQLVEGTASFSDWSQHSSTNGEAHGMGMEVFDYDEDGDLDILVSNTNESPYLFQNIGRARNSNWLQVDLEGTASNRDAFGAVIIAFANGQSFHRFHYGAGLMSQSIQPVHFGLGQTKMVDSLLIQWPSGHREVILNVAVNQKIKVVETANLTTSTKKVFLRPVDLQLSKVFPNPFDESISIEISANKPGILYCNIYSLTGELIRQSQVNVEHPGPTTLEWKGINANGRKMPAGMYWYQIRLNNSTLTGKIILR